MINHSGNHHHSTSDIGHAITSSSHDSYLFTLHPTFTQGLILGQLSILVLLGVVLKYLFLDSSAATAEVETQALEKMFAAGAHGAPTHAHARRAPPPPLPLPLGAAPYPAALVGEPAVVSAAAAVAVAVTVSDLGDAFSLEDGAGPEDGETRAAREALDERSGVSVEEAGEKAHGMLESTEWLNALLVQIAEVYRAKLCGCVPGLAGGNEIARRRVEEFMNTVRPSGFLDYIQVHSVDLGMSAPRLSKARAETPKSAGASASHEQAGTGLHVTYMDTVSISLSTAYLFHHPKPYFARLPVSLTIALSRFVSSVRIVPPNPTSAAPLLTFSLAPDFVLDLRTTSLMGSRAKLADVPKLHELIQHQARRFVAARGTWTVALPGLAVPESEPEPVPEAEAHAHAESSGLGSPLSVPEWPRPPL